ncbi:MAG: glycosyltransferase family 39 protein [Spirochaetia bacterium]|nr:glycosyltransferase family 39 protein [Spirochaetia bacterium]
MQNFMPVYFSGVALLTAFVLSFFGLKIETETADAVAQVMNIILLMISGAAALLMDRLYGSRERRRLRSASAIIWKSSFFLAAIAMLRLGFVSFDTNYFIRGYSFFGAGAALLLFMCYITDESGRQMQFPIPVFKPAGARTVTVKMFIAVALSLLAVFFIRQRMELPATAALLVCLFQLGLLFIRRDALGPAAPGVTSTLTEDSLKKRVMQTLLLAAAFFLFYKTLEYMQEYSVMNAVTMFALGIMALVAMHIPSSGAEQGHRNALTPNTPFDYIYGVLLFVCCLFIYSFQLDIIPPGIHGDEVLTVNMARTIAQDKFGPVFIESAQFQVTVLHYYILALVGRFFPIDITMCRWVSIVIGSLSPVFLYLLGRELAGRRAGVIASLLLSVFFMQMFYSRYAMSWIYVPSLAVIAYYLFFRGMLSGKNRYFIISGAFMAINFGMYSAGKVAILPVLFYTAFMFMRRETRPEVMANARGIVLLLVSAVLMFSPVIDYIIAYPDKYFARMSGMSVIQPSTLGYETFGRVALNVLKNVQMFITQSADGYAHNLPQKPFLDILSSFWFIAGIAWLCVTWKRERSSFVILWLIFGLLPGFLSKLGPEDPYPARTVFAIPALMLVMAMGIESAWKAIERLWPKYAGIVMPLVVLFSLGEFAFYNLNNFFVVFKNDPHTQTYYRSTDRIVAEVVRANRGVRFLVSPFFISNYYYGMVPDLDERISREDLSLFSLNRVYTGEGQAVGLIGDGILSKMFPIYNEYFPGADIKIFYDPNFWQFDTSSPIKYCYEWKYPDKVIALNRLYSWFYVYDYKTPWVRMSLAMVPWSDIDALFCAKVVYSVNGRRVEGVLKGLDVTPPVGTSDGEISCMLDTQVYGYYTFSADKGNCVFYVDGNRVNGRVRLFKGLHRFTVKFTGCVPFRVTWNMPGYGDRTIERRYTLNTDKRYGLLVTYKNSGKVDQQVLEPMINYRLYYFNRRTYFETEIDNTFNYTATGTVDMGKPGIYYFKVDSIYDADVYINGARVFTRRGDRETLTPIRLGNGPVSVKLTGNYAYVSNMWMGATLQFVYRQEGQREFGPVGYDKLAPGL